MDQDVEERKLARQEQFLEGTVCVREILAYIEQDHYLDKRAAAAYVSLSIRTIGKHLDEIPHFRVGTKVVFKKSELDRWMETWREGGQADLDQIVKKAVAGVLA